MVEEDMRIWLGRLLSTRPGTRQEALDALGALGAPAMPHLLALLEQSPSAPVREAAASALLSVVMHERKGGPYVDRRGDFHALRQGVRAMAGPLARHLDDASPIVRRVVVQALGLLEDWRSVEGLLRALRSPFEGFRTLALDSLRRITGRDFGSVEAWERWWEQASGGEGPQEP